MVARRKHGRRGRGFFSSVLGGIKKFGPGLLQKVVPIALGALADKHPNAAAAVGSLLGGRSRRRRHGGGRRKRRHHGGSAKRKGGGLHRVASHYRRVKGGRRVKVAGHMSH